MNITENLQYISFNLFVKCYCFVLAIIFLVNSHNQLLYFKSNVKRKYINSQKIFNLITIPLITKKVFVFYGFSFVISLIFIVFDFFTTISGLLAIFFYFMYFSQIQSLSYIQRKTNTIPIILLVIVVSSIYNFPTYIFGHVWEILLLKIVFSQMYLSAGINKIRLGGLRWLNGHSTQAYLLENYLWNGNKLTLLISNNIVFCAFLSYLIFLYEVSFWIIIIYPQFTLFFVLFSLSFHLSTNYLMKINYLKYLAPFYFIFFIDNKTFIFELLKYYDQFILFFKR